MTHATPLIATVVAGLVLAFILGAIAFRLKASPLVGYLLAGVIVGPFTPGYVADQGLANELAELGVILLMFGVGLHFSTRDLMSVKSVAIPGAMAQIAVATVLGVGLGHLMGWSMAGSIVFGLSLSVASTVVLLRALQDRRLVDTQRGRIAIGWLIVEDLVMVFTLVMLPALGGAQTSEALLSALLLTTAKVGAFVAFMLIVGRRVIPWALHAIAHTGSRELFRLAVLAIALGVAFGAAHLFSVSFALGAFFAGMILAGSQLSQRAADETLPLRDAFAVLFFVSVGMLFNPAIILTQALPLLGTLMIILVGKSIAAFMIIRAFGRDRRTALTIAASLAQIGEFSFILASLGTGLQLMPAAGRDLILAGAMISILFNPLLFVLIDRFCGAGGEMQEQPRPPAETVAEVEARHVVIIGYGRVGAMVGAGLKVAGQPFVVIETQADIDALPRGEALDVIIGNAANPKTLERADLVHARQLIVAIPQVFEAGQIVQQARATNPGLTIVARAHSDEEVAHLERCGADVTIMGEREIAKRMIDQAVGVLSPA